MANGAKGSRLSKIARDFNVGISTIVEFLNKKGLDIDSNPNNKVPAEYYDLLVKEYSSDSAIKKESEKLIRTSSVRKETITLDGPPEDEEDDDVEEVEETKTVEVVEEVTAEVEDAPEVEEIVKEDKEEVQESVIVEEPVVTPKPVEEHVVEEVVEEVAETVAEEKVEESPKPAKEEDIEEKIEEKIVAEEVEPEPAKEEVVEEAPIEEPVAEDTVEETEETEEQEEDDDGELKVVGKIDLKSINQKTRPGRKSKKEKEEEKIKKDQEKASAKEQWKKKVTVPGDEETQNETVDKPKAKVESAVAKPVEKQPKVEPIPEKKEEPEAEIYRSKVEILAGPTVVGKIVLPVEEKRKAKKPVASSSDAERQKNKKKRKRIKNEKVDIDKKKEQIERKKRPVTAAPAGKSKKRVVRAEVSEEDVQKQIKDTLARLTSKGKSKTSKYRRTKREDVRQKAQDDFDKEELEKNVIKVSEFVSVSELGTMMNIEVIQIISTCMGLGLLVSINQRLDAETIALVADEFGYEVEFISVDIQSEIIDEEEDEANLIQRPPIVTVMGHVDHGKTSLLDYIRSANVISGEAGGITQHIGAYGVKLPDGKKITFLDTPGHEAFTAMRARGASVTDIAIIVVAADDAIMPQTIEAINHATAAGVPIIFAINKIDKPGANPEKIKEALANMNFLVEDWGGKYQSQEISAKHGTNIEELLEKVLLESEILELKANPNRNASGSIIESSLDKGRGYVATMLVQTGTLKVGDIILAGSYTGHVKAMYNEIGMKVKEVGPSMPALILGLNGAPQAGDRFNVMNSERDAREIANKREQLLREQGLRTQKHITLDEIGRRLALGDFHEINVIVKGDVDGSIEALSDSLIKLSTEAVQVNVIHKAVGAISESDILLATASNAVVVGFQVRPSMGARQLAEKEQIDIRLYSIIYDAINEMKDAMEGMLSPDTKEEIVATLEVREVFKITKVGTIAGCIVKGGKIHRNTSIRIIREGIVVYTGSLGSLKRFKDDVKEVGNGYECGLNIDKYNDIKVGDIIEGYKIVEVKRTL